MNFKLEFPTDNILTRPEVAFFAQRSDGFNSFLNAPYKTELIVGDLVFFSDSKFGVISTYVRSNTRVTIFGYSFTPSAVDSKSVTNKINIDAKIGENILLNNDSSTGHIEKYILKIGKIVYHIIAINDFTNFKSSIIVKTLRRG